jgi:hypothetical protein
MYEEEKDQHPEAPQLDRSRRTFSARRSDEGSQEGSQQKGMPRKGARMKVGDLVSFRGSVGIVVEVGSFGVGYDVMVMWHDETVPMMEQSVRLKNESR